MRTVKIPTEDPLLALLAGRLTAFQEMLQAANAEPITGVKHVRLLRQRIGAIKEQLSDRIVNILRAMGIDDGQIIEANLHVEYLEDHENLRTVIHVKTNGVGNLN